MIYTNKGMLLDKDLCDVIPYVCPLIDHGSRPMKALEFLMLLLYKRLLSTTDLLQAKLFQQLVIVLQLNNLSTSCE
jgi:hypothetical protein